MMTAEEIKAWNRAMNQKKEVSEVGNKKVKKGKSKGSKRPC